MFRGTHRKHDYKGVIWKGTCMRARSANVQSWQGLIENGWLSFFCLNKRWKDSDGGGEKLEIKLSFPFLLPSFVALELWIWELYHISSAPFFNLAFNMVSEFQNYNAFATTNIVVLCSASTVVVLCFVTATTQLHSTILSPATSTQYWQALHLIIPITSTSSSSHLFCFSNHNYNMIFKKFF